MTSRDINILSSEGRLLSVVSLSDKQLADVKSSAATVKDLRAIFLEGTPPPSVFDGFQFERCAPEDEQTTPASAVFGNLVLPSCAAAVSATSTSKNNKKEKEKEKNNKTRGRCLLCENENIINNLAGRRCLLVSDAPLRRPDDQDFLRSFCRGHHYKVYRDAASQRFSEKEEQEDKTNKSPPGRAAPPLPFVVIYTKSFLERQFFSISDHHLAAAGVGGGGDKNVIVNACATRDAFGRTLLHELVVSTSSSSTASQSPSSSSSSPQLLRAVLDLLVASEKIHEVIDIVDSNGHTALWHACRRRRVSDAELLLTVGGADPLFTCSVKKFRRQKVAAQQQEESYPSSSSSSSSSWSSASVLLADVVNTPIVCPLEQALLEFCDLSSNNSKNKNHPAHQSLSSLLYKMAGHKRVVARLVGPTSTTAAAPAAADGHDDHDVYQRDEYFSRFSDVLFDRLFVQPILAIATPTTATNHHHHHHPCRDASAPEQLEHLLNHPYFVACHQQQVRLDTSLFMKNGGGSSPLHLLASQQQRQTKNVTATATTNPPEQNQQQLAAKCIRLLLSSAQPGLDPTFVSVASLSASTLTTPARCIHSTTLTPLMLAARAGNFPVVTELLAAAASTTSSHHQHQQNNNSGTTDSSSSSDHKNDKNKNILCITNVDASGRTALHYALMAQLRNNNSVVTPSKEEQQQHALVTGAILSALVERKRVFSSSSSSSSSSPSTSWEDAATRRSVCNSDVTGETVFTLCCRNGDPETLQALIDVFGVSAATAADGSSPRRHHHRMINIDGRPKKIPAILRKKLAEADKRKKCSNKKSSSPSSSTTELLEACLCGITSHEDDETNPATTTAAASSSVMIGKLKCADICLSSIYNNQDKKTSTATSTTTRQHYNLPSLTQLARRIMQLAMVEATTSTQSSLQEMELLVNKCGLGMIDLLRHLVCCQQPTQQQKESSSSDSDNNDVTPVVVTVTDKVCELMNCILEEANRPSLRQKLLLKRKSIVASPCCDDVNDGSVLLTTRRVFDALFALLEEAIVSASNNDNDNDNNVSPRLREALINGCGRMARTGVSYSTLHIFIRLASFLPRDKKAQKRNEKEEEEKQRTLQQQSEDPSEDDRLIASLVPITPPQPDYGTHSSDRACKYAWVLRCLLDPTFDAAHFYKMIVTTSTTTTKITNNTSPSIFSPTVIPNAIPRILKVAVLGSVFASWRKGIPASAEYGYTVDLGRIATNVAALYREEKQEEKRGNGATRGEWSSCWELVLTRLVDSCVAVGSKDGVAALVPLFDREWHVSWLKSSSPESHVKKFDKQLRCSLYRDKQWGNVYHRLLKFSCETGAAADVLFFPPYCCCDDDAPGENKKILYHVTRFFDPDCTCDDADMSLAPAQPASWFHPRARFLSQQSLRVFFKCSDSGINNSDANNNNNNNDFVVDVPSSPQQSTSTRRRLLLAGSAIRMPGVVTSCDFVSACFRGDVAVISAFAAAARADPELLAACAAQIEWSRLGDCGQQDILSNWFYFPNDNKVRAIRQMLSSSSWPEVFQRALVRAMVKFSDGSGFGFACSSTPYESNANVLLRFLEHTQFDATAIDYKAFASLLAKHADAAATSRPSAAVQAATEDANDGNNNDNNDNFVILRQHWQDLYFARTLKHIFEHATAQNLLRYLDDLATTHFNDTVLFKWEAFGQNKEVRDAAVRPWEMKSVILHAINLIGKSVDSKRRKRIAGNVRAVLLSGRYGKRYFSASATADKTNNNNNNDIDVERQREYSAIVSNLIAVHEFETATLLLEDHAQLPLRAPHFGCVYVSSSDNDTATLHHDGMHPLFMLAMMATTSSTTAGDAAAAAAAAAADPLYKLVVSRSLEGDVAHLCNPLKTTLIMSGTDLEHLRRAAASSGTTALAVAIRRRNERMATEILQQYPSLLYRPCATAAVMVSSQPKTQRRDRKYLYFACPDEARVFEARDVSPFEVAVRAGAMNIVRLLVDFHQRRTEQQQQQQQQQQEKKLTSGMALSQLLSAPSPDDNNTCGAAGGAGTVCDIFVNHVCKSGDVNTVRFFLDVFGDEIRQALQQQQRSNNKTPLQVALLRGHDELALFLLHHHNDDDGVFSSSSSSSSTDHATQKVALFFAAVQGRCRGAIQHMMMRKNDGDDAAMFATSSCDVTLPLFSSSDVVVPEAAATADSSRHDQRHRCRPHHLTAVEFARCFGDIDTAELLWRHPANNRSHRCFVEALPMSYTGLLSGAVAYGWLADAMKKGEECACANNIDGEHSQQQQQQQRKVAFPWVRDSKDVKEEEKEEHHHRFTTTYEQFFAPVAAAEAAARLECARESRAIAAACFARDYEFATSTASTTQHTLGTALQWKFDPEARSTTAGLLLPHVHEVVHPSPTRRWIWRYRSVANHYQVSKREFMLLGHVRGKKVPAVSPTTSTKTDSAMPAAASEEVTTAKKSTPRHAATDDSSASSSSSCSPFIWRFNMFATVALMRRLGRAPFCPWRSPSSLTATNMQSGVVVRGNRLLSSSPFHTNPNSDSSYWYSCYSRGLCIVRWPQSNNGCESYSPFMGLDDAVRSGSVELCRAILDMDRYSLFAVHGAVFGSKYGEVQGSTPLEMALATGKADVAEFFLRHIIANMMSSSSTSTSTSTSPTRRANDTSKQRQIYIDFVVKFFRHNMRKLLHKIVVGSAINLAVLWMMNVLEELAMTSASTATGCSPADADHQHHPLWSIFVSAFCDKKFASTTDKEKDESVSNKKSEHQQQRPRYSDDDNDDYQPPVIEPMDDLRPFDFAVCTGAAAAMISIAHQVLRCCKKHKPSSQSGEASSSPSSSNSTTNNNSLHLLSLDGLDDSSLRSALFPLHRTVMGMIVSSWNGAVNPAVTAVLFDVFGVTANCWREEQSEQPMSNQDREEWLERFRRNFVDVRAIGVATLLQIARQWDGKMTPTAAAGEGDTAVVEVGPTERHFSNKFSAEYERSIFDRVVHEPLGTLDADVQINVAWATVVGRDDAAVIRRLGSVVADRFANIWGPRFFNDNNTKNKHMHSAAAAASVEEKASVPDPDSDKCSTSHKIKIVHLNFSQSADEAATKKIELHAIKEEDKEQHSRCEITDTICINSEWWEGRGADDLFMWTNPTQLDSPVWRVVPDLDTERPVDEKTRRRRRIEFDEEEESYGEEEEGD